MNDQNQYQGEGFADPSNQKKEPIITKETATVLEQNQPLTNNQKLIPRTKKFDLPVFVAFLVIGIWFLVFIFVLGTLFVSSKQTSRFYEQTGIGKYLPNPFAKDSSSECFNTIRRKALNNLPDPDQQMSKTCDEQIKALNDKYAQYFSDQEYQDFIKQINNTYSGVGMQMGKRSPDGYPIVKKVITEVEDPSKVPAKIADVREGDIITKIDDFDPKDKTDEEIVSKIKGPKGTIVTIEFLRGQERLTKSITRQEITMFSVKVIVKDRNLLVLANSTFSQSIYQETINEIKKIDQNSYDQVIVDLRGNPGGSLDAAVDMTSIFVPKGSVAVKERTKNSKLEQKTEYDPIVSNKTVVVTINEDSASASEILAGALKDLKNAKLVGKKSYGKGVAQSLEPLQSGGAIKYTVAEWYTPNGTALNGQGLVPDKECDLKEAFSEDEGYNQLVKCLTQ
jgi:carboxyl-terminal processing protease